MPPFRRMNRSSGSASDLRATAYRMTRDHLLRVRLSALAGSAVHRMMADAKALLDFAQNQNPAIR